ncbi:MAG TPA: L,D-transpeptidase family protein [Gaiellaceae bacterium]|nr:L,D-transpeptidase family protein [Gaiellaceae bacterium]
MLLASLLVAALNLACPTNVANSLRPAPGGSQLITVEAHSTKATHAALRTWRRDARGCWVAVAGPYPARVGYNGLRADRREGDGTTPIGTFRIGSTMYGIAPNPGVRYPYVRLRCGDWWVEDPRSPWYNTFRRVPCGQEPPFRTTTGDMASERRAFVHLAVVEFNVRPIVPGRGSGIFLHAQTGRPTAGCISLRRDDLVRVLRWLSPRAQPRIAIGTSAALRGRG